ncbi:tyrosine-type recombinase/integrase [Salibacterium salarium]|uniref:tyrosine-type recombinase/integrase n=1 Tax=Salibacterium salarium TaxID=284579 RepID=UPI001FEB2F3A|nr:site-specific integrase [Salibacterium salarium]
MEWQLLKENPVANVKSPKVPQGASSTYDNQEVEQLKAALEHEPLHWKVMILLVITTGMRRGEVLGLEWEHIDLEIGIIDIKQSLVNQKLATDDIVKEPKTGRTRIVSLPEPLIELLKVYKKEANKNRLETAELWEGGKYFFAFSSWHGKPMYPSSITTWWRRFVKRHGLRHIRFHDLRHTSATILLNQGVHAKVISERLGHADIKTTMNIYSHVLRSADQEAAKHFNNLFATSEENNESS